MDDQLSAQTSETLSKVNDLLDWIGTKANDATTFTMAQAPEVAREIIAWGVWSNAVQVLMFVLAFVLSLWFLGVGSMSQRFKALGDLETDGPKIGVAIVRLVVGGVASMVTALALLVEGSICAKAALQALIAPRLYLLEWCRDAIGGVN